MSGDVHPAWAPVFARNAAWWAGRNRWGDTLSELPPQTSGCCAHREHGACSGRRRDLLYQFWPCGCQCHGEAA